ncbi:hypothetical protein Tco_0228792 [Tanacetum coccineum]
MSSSLQSLFARIAPGFTTPTTTSGLPPTQGLSATGIMVRLLLEPVSEERLLENNGNTVKDKQLQWKDDTIKEFRDAPDQDIMKVLKCSTKLKVVETNRALESTRIQLNRYDYLPFRIHLDGLKGSTDRLRWTQAQPISHSTVSCIDGVLEVPFRQQIMSHPADYEYCFAAYKSLFKQVMVMAIVGDHPENSGHLNELVKSKKHHKASRRKAENTNTEVPILYNGPTLTNLANRLESINERIQWPRTSSSKTYVPNVTELRTYCFKSGTQPFSTIKDPEPPVVPSYKETGRRDCFNVLMMMNEFVSDTDLVVSIKLRLMSCCPSGTTEAIASPHKLLSQMRREGRNEVERGRRVDNWLARRRDR